MAAWLCNSNFVSIALEDYDSPAIIARLVYKCAEERWEDVAVPNVVPVRRTKTDVVIPLRTKSQAAAQENNLPT